LLALSDLDWARLKGTPWQQLQDAEVLELYRLTKALDEGQRERRMDRYRELPHLTPFHQSRARIRMLIGGNRSGKTTAGLMEFLRYMLGTHPYRPISPPNQGWIVIPDLDVARDVILPMMMQYLPSSEILRFNRLEMTLELRCGSSFKFKSSESDVSKFQSAERRIIWFDEEPRREIWEECLMRTGADQPLDIVLTMTPLQGMDWSYDDIYLKQQPGEIEVFPAHTINNVHLPLAERERLALKFKGSEDEAARLRGEYFSRSGVIYKDFNKLRHVVDPFPIPASWPVIAAVDPHPRKPSVCLVGALSPENFLYITHEVIGGEDMLLKDFAEMIRKILVGKRVFRRLIDPSALAKDMRSGKSIRDELAQHGVPTQPAINDVFFGIEEVRKRLRGGQLMVFRTCSRLLWEIEHYQWDEYRGRGKRRDVKEEPKKIDDDLCDCLRYLCASKIEFEPETYDIALPTPVHEPVRTDPYTGF